ncbi:MAG: hypothetical protein ABI615_11990 [Chthoniobacterales bacterium]
MPRILSLLFLISIASVALAEKDSDFIQPEPITGGSAPAPVSTGNDFKNIRTAIDALPGKYKNGVIKISADGGNPNPKEWYFVAHNAEKKRAVFNITINHGDIVEEGFSRDPRAIFSRASAIDFSRVLVDTDGAWQACEKFVHAKNKKLGSVSYVLEQSGKDAAPIWSLWCYSPRNGYIGMIKILATTGDVVESK